MADSRGDRPRLRGQSGEPVCPRENGKPAGAQLLSEAEQRRGATYDSRGVRWGKGVQPEPPSAPRSQPGSEDGGSRKAGAGRSKTVAERQAAPRMPMPQWGAKPRRPSRRGGANPLKSNIVRTEAKPKRRRVQRRRLSGFAPRRE